MSNPHINSSSDGLRPVQTADCSETIWSAVTENDFRNHLVTLEKRTNAVPIDVLTAQIITDGIAEANVLPFSVERSLADDLAYLAAVTEGAQSVAAVCLEQYVESKLIVRVAGMDVVDQKVRGMLSGIAQVLERSSASSKSGGDPTEWEENSFAMIIEQHSQKLLGRMRSVRWVKPTYLRKTHKKPLFRDFGNVAHRVQHIYPKKGQWKTRKVLITVITALEKEYEQFETAILEDQIQELKRLVKATFDFCKVPEVGAFASTIESVVGPTPQIAAAVKTLRQLEKIGAYWRIARSLAATATRYPDSFRRVELEYVMPYAEAETDIAYESWAKIMHVHAEVQLVVEYAIRRQKGERERELKEDGDVSRIVWPRTIGTSKYLCYLCYLFLREHGEFGQALSSHGRLFDQWTVPDLKEYESGTREKFAEVLGRVDKCVLTQTESLHRDLIWRPEPMTSRQDLLIGFDGEDEPAVQEMETLEQKLSAI